jgi:hypothetical protein
MAATIGIIIGALIFAGGALYLAGAITIYKAIKTIHDEEL